MKLILNHPLGVKSVVVLLLLALLQIGVSMVSGLVSERSSRQQDVRHDIARSSSSEQRMIGPFIAIDYTETVHRDEHTHTVERQTYILPDTFTMKAHLNSFEKYRGMYRARLYRAESMLTGSFDLSSLGQFTQHRINTIHMVVGVQDSRGLIKLNTMALGGNAFSAVPGTGIKQLPQGFHFPLALEQLDLTQPLEFDLNFLLQGMGKLQITPIGKQSTVELSSEWPHPSFIGDSLPITSEITNSGFSAQWSSNNLSSNINPLFEHCMSDKALCSGLHSRQMGVDLIDPVDHYLKSHRSINYSLLVMTLVFASFFLLELFQLRPIHPVQYGLVGVALALFYLLLISLSEHIGFNTAYIVSALSSTSLLSIYLAGVLDNTRQGAAFGISLLCLYGLLFGLLQAESYALLMGTLLCFVVLSVVMILTRKIDWYQYGKSANHSDNGQN